MNDNLDVCVTCGMDWAKLGTGGQCADCAKLLQYTLEWLFSPEHRIRGLRAEKELRRRRKLNPEGRMAS